MRGVSEWREEHRFVHLLEHQNRLYVVRRNSLSILSPICSEQHLLEDYGEEDKLRDEEQKKRGYK